VFSQFSTRSPQIEYVLDRERAKTLGVAVSSVFSTLQSFLGGAYINDFNLFGRTYPGHRAGRSDRAQRARIRRRPVRALRRR
jgi:multidrug efflux pump subunit AcrB